MLHQITGDRLADLRARYCQPGDPIGRAISTETARGRSSNVALIGAEQFASEVDKQIFDNSATRVFGRTGSSEIAGQVYRRLSDEMRVKLTTLSQGLMARFRFGWLCSCGLSRHYRQSVPQIAALSGVSLLILLLGMVAPANWVNLTLSAREVGGAIMPPGMIMDRDTPAEAMWDMAAIHPRYVTAGYGLDATGDRELAAFEGGAKVFDLETTVIRWTILPGTTVDAYTFNSQLPGPRLRIREGDHVRINVTNRLPESTTVHWHGLILPNEMDGPAEITQAPIAPGDTYRYEFTAIQSGTFFYHSHDHVDRQQALGLYGALIIDPAQSDPTLTADHDYVLLLPEWLLREGLTYPAMPMDGGQPNFFTINGRAYPATSPVRMKVGETVKVRFIGSNKRFHPSYAYPRRPLLGRRARWIDFVARCTLRG